MSQPKSLDVTQNPSPQDVADSLHSSAIHLLRALKGKDKIMGINPAQLSALSVLYFLGPLTISKLARADGVKAPTISRLIKDMERLGYVMRTRAENDARSVHVMITPKGAALFERARVNRLMALTKALENLNPESLETLAKAAILMENAAHSIREG